MLLSLSLAHAACEPRDLVGDAIEVRIKVARDDYVGVLAIARASEASLPCLDGALSREALGEIYQAAGTAAIRSTPPDPALARSWFGKTIRWQLPFDPTVGPDAASAYEDARRRLAATPTGRLAPETTLLVDGRLVRAGERLVAPPGEHLVQYPGEGGDLVNAVVQLESDTTLKVGPAAEPTARVRSPAAAPVVLGGIGLFVAGAATLFVAGQYHENVTTFQEVEGECTGACDAALRNRNLLAAAGVFGVAGGSALVVTGGVVLSGNNVPVVTLRGRW